MVAAAGRRTEKAPQPKPTPPDPTPWSTCSPPTYSCKRHAHKDINIIFNGLNGWPLDNNLLNIEFWSLSTLWIILFITQQRSHRNLNLVSQRRIDGLLQNRRRSTVNAFELRLFCIKPSICLLVKDRFNPSAMCWQWSYTTFALNSPMYV